MTSKTVVEIIGKDSTAAAFRSAQGNLSALAATSAKVASAFAAIGGTAAIAGLTAITKNVIDAQDEISKLSQKTGLSVRSLAGLEFAAAQSGVEFDRLAKGVRSFSRLVAESGDSSSDAAKKLSLLGLSFKELQSLNPEEQFIRLADALREYSEEDRAAALTAILGDRMADLVPLLSVGADGLRQMMEEGKKLNPVTAESAKQAELFNDNMDRLARTAGQLSKEMTMSIIPALAEISEKMVAVTRQSGLLAGAWAGVQTAFNLAFGESQAQRVDELKTSIATMERQLAQLGNPKFGNSGFSDAIIENLAKARGQLSVLEKAQGSLSVASENTSTATKKLSSEILKLDSASASTSARTSKLADDQKKLADAEKRRLDQLREEGRRLTESLDPLVKRNNEIERYKTLLESGAISEGIYTQAVDQSTQDYLKALGFVEREIESIDTGTKKLEKTSVQVFDSMEQIAIQGVRNIQSSFADGIFNFFDNGLNGMVKSVTSALGRIASEFASIKLLQAAGGLFGLGGASTAFASGGGGGLGALNLASLGSSAANLFSTGLGATGMIGGGLSALGGSSALGMFGAGMQGGSAGAAFIATESATGGAAASLGATMGSVAGPLIALAVADQIGRLLAGNKSTGTFVDSIPVIGGFASALFGRGPLKQGMTVLKGDIGTGGFESGGINTRFDAKGGLLRSNKTDFAGVDAVTGQITTDNKDLRKYADSIAEASRQIIASINATVTSTADSLYDLAGNLGISTSGLDDFNTQIKIVSEAGKFLSEEKIAEEVSRITKEMALSLLPSLEELGKQGEDAFGTLQRLSNEFSILKNSATILGLSIAESSELIKNMSFESRTEFVDAAGGMDVFLSKVQLFANEFLTEEQRIAPVIETTLEHLNNLGLGFIRTRDQFTELVQSFGKDGGISENQLQGLLGLAGAADQIFDYLDSIKQAEDIKLPVEEKVIDNSAAILSERNGLERQYYQLIGDTASIRRMELDALDPSNRALLERIYLIEDERIAQENAARERAQLESDIKSAFGILQNAVNSEISSITDKFKGLISEVDASIRETSSSISKLASISDALKSTVDQIRGVNAGEARLQIQKAINSATQGNIVDLDSIRGALSSLGSLDTSGFSSREDFARQTSRDASLIEKLGSAVEDQLTVEERTLETLEDQKTQLQGQFEEEHKTLTGILNKAQEQIDSIIGVDKSLNTLLGKKSPFVSSIQSIALSISQMVSNLQDTQGFASGGYHPGGLRIVGENGPELEATGPSRIISNSDLANMIGGGGGSTVNINLAGLEKSIDRLNGLVEQVITYTKQTSDTLMRVSDDGLSLRTTAA